MFGGHVDKQITAYIHNEMSAQSAEKFRAHLAKCRRCRELHEQMRFAALAVSRLSRHDAPDSLWEKIESRIILENPAESPARTPMAFSWQAALAVAAVLALALLIARPLLFRPVSPPKKDNSTVIARGSFPVTALEGAPRIGENVVTQGRIKAGEWLETDSRSTARVQIADIGHANVKPNSRLQLVNSAPNEHRMRLDRGEVHARVVAPPRLFMVETPSALAVDLGCEYTLKANSDGTSLLHVISGWVAMEFAGRASEVPAMMSCITKPGIAPGTPFHKEAHPDLVEALKRFDFAGGNSADVDIVLRLAKTTDSLTLWNLLQRVSSQETQRVYSALHKLVKAPKSATLVAVAAGDQQALEEWKEEIELAIYPAPQGLDFGNLAINVMRLTNKAAKPQNKGAKP